MRIDNKNDILAYREYDDDPIVFVDPDWSDEDLAEAVEDVLDDWSIGDTIIASKSALVDWLDDDSWDYLL